MAVDVNAAANRRVLARRPLPLAETVPPDADSLVMATGADHVELLLRRHRRIFSFDNSAFYERVDLGF